MANEKNFDFKRLKELQNKAVAEIEKVGTRINYTKDISKFADIMYKMQRRVPIINIEGSLLGQKFGIVIGYPLDYEKIVRTNKYKIFHLVDWEQFKKDWQAYVNEQLEN